MSPVPQCHRENKGQVSSSSGNILQGWAKERAWDACVFRASGLLETFLCLFAQYQIVFCIFLQVQYVAG